MNQNELDQIYKLASDFFYLKKGENYKLILEEFTLYKVEDNICYLYTSNAAVAEQMELIKNGVLECLVNVLKIKGLTANQIVIKREIETNDFTAVNVEQDSLEEDLDYDTGLLPQFTIDGFVTGKGAEMSVLVCKEVIKGIVEDREDKLTPLLIYGDSGLGKTHLGQAIGNEVLTLRSDKKVKYITAEEFNNEFLQSITKGALKNLDNISRSDSFRQKYRKLDLLIIDDIQFFERVFGKGGGSVEEEFFNTFNTLYSEKKQVVFISDRSIDEIKNFTDRIITRIDSGVRAEVKKPDFSTRVAILRKICEEKNQEVDDKPIEYIATHVNQSVRDLQGILKSVITTSQLTDRPVDIDMVKGVLEKRMIAIKSTITAESIAKKVSKHYDLKLEDIKSVKRNKAIVRARHICIYLIKNNLDITLDAIGKVFDRDHSTVISSLRKIEDMINNDKEFESEIKSLDRMIKE